MKKIVVAITILIIGIVGSIDDILSPNGFNIEVKNQTNKKISGLYLTYDNIMTDIKIPLMEPGKSYKFNVNPAEDFAEGTMKLQYKDNKGKLHKEYLIGYFEKGYSGNATASITSVDQNGKLEFETKNEISLY